MSVKKLLVLTAAGLLATAATAVMAGGPDHNMVMPTQAAFVNSIYIDAHVGYAQSNWNTFNSNNVIGNGASSAFGTTTNGSGGVIGGVDMGYNITQHIAAEAGWFYLPQVTGTGGNASFGTTTSQTMQVNSWFAYMAAKLSVPVMEDLDLFGKIGVAYRSLSYNMPSGISDTLTSVTGNGHIWSPLFGAGIQYSWSNWLVGGQYLYLPSDSNANFGNTPFGAPNAAPGANLYTAFLGYKFNV